MTTHPLHVVTGAGPVGTTVALQLADAGHPVRLLTRSGSGPEHPLVERRQVDVSRPEQLEAAFDGAAAVHHCIHASAYQAKAWRAELPSTEQAVMDAAHRVGAVVVFPESLYAYGPVDGVMTEDLPRGATTGKPGVRAALLRAREEHPVATVSVAASDFLGPRVRTSHAGERLVPRVLAGQTVRPMGRTDVPHSFTYVPDLARAMVHAARTPELWNSFLHAPTGPAVSQGDLARGLAEAAGVPALKLKGMPVPLVRTVGLVSGELRELAELGYQFDRPFVVDSSASEARLGLAPTPFDVQLKETVAWWREQA